MWLSPNILQLLQILNKKKNDEGGSKRNDVMRLLKIDPRDSLPPLSFKHISKLSPMTATILPADIVSQNILPAAADNRGTTGFGIIIRPLTPPRCLPACYIRDKDVTKLIPSKTLGVFCQVARGGLLVTLARHFTCNRKVSKKDRS